ncbi:DNA repair protein complementing XP-C cells isoform X2 [Oryzias melastigma]|uniref:DNA repair protein complementing XP-C cells isoform X2 n=1 Tax=Oryzias melastigma TaxID=30732 RepID=UPI000CF81839|nr:DNA repair protein complementing XP-C cells isoform X2 [Oryzias melastigma]
MAKRKKASETDVDTKKPRLPRAKRSAAKTRPKKKAADEELQRKVKPKPRPPSKRAMQTVSASSPTAGPDVQTSKYFKTPLTGEIDSEDEFDLVTSPPPIVEAKCKKPVKDKEEEEEESDSEDDDDWEEVEELAEPLGPAEASEPSLPSEPVEIEIETAEVRKRKKRQEEFETYLRRMMKRYKKDLLIDTHKVHLLCLLANGIFRNRLCGEPDLLAVTLSLLPAHFCSVDKKCIDQNYLCALLKWFRATFTLNPLLPQEEDPSDLPALLERRLATFTARDHQEMTHLFLLVLRSLQLFCRLVLSLQPVPFKPPSAKSKGVRTSTSQTSRETSETNSPEQKVSPGSKRPQKEKKLKQSGGGKKAKTKEIKHEEEKLVLSGGRRPKNSKRRRVASKVSYKEESNSEGDEEEEDGEDFQATSEEEEDSDFESEVKPRKGKMGKGKATVTASKKNVGPKKKNDGKKHVKDEEDSDWEEEKQEDDERVEGTGKRRSVRRGGPGADEWLEVFLEKSSSWVCVDVEHGVGMPQLCSQNATEPVTYVVAVDGNGFLKDLGRKYDPTWMTTSRKRRVDDDWWEETLQFFLGPEDERDVKEEKELQSKLLNKPLPISVAEYKNHPLYALKRHLLKYEALYPATATVLGYCRGEPVYSRDCVHTLHSRDTWLKEARTVRLGEEPYKMVKGFSNRSRKARMASEQKDHKDLGLFGEWQTEEYQPPIAVDGKVPRNEYGNVYLFKPCMLPVGCVHLRLPNLHRVAKKLNLDAAAAVTGFDYHGGYSHAVTDGYIVCEEDEEILRAAWVEEQEIQKKKEKEKKEKRAVANWTLLVKGLLIRERLRQRYSQKNQGVGSVAREDDAGGFSSDDEAAAAGGDGDGAKTASETLAMSWPQNRQTQEGGGGAGTLKKTTKRGRKGQEQHLFPFEKV